jgi:hypothetical protein
MTPLEYILTVINDHGQPYTRRDEMAKAMAPYIHQRLAAVEIPEKPIRHRLDLTKLDDNEQALMARLVSKARFLIDPDDGG